MMCLRWMGRLVAVAIVSLLAVTTMAQDNVENVSPDSGRWKLEACGEFRGITWNIEESVLAGLPLPHRDHIEMSGEQVSVVLRYGVNENRAFELNRSMVWPMLRTIPNNTHASLMRRFDFDIPAMLKVDGKPLGKETVIGMDMFGVLGCRSRFAIENGEIHLTRMFYPSTTRPMLCEDYVVTNRTDRERKLEIPVVRIEDHTDAAKGVNGSYTTLVSSLGDGTFTLKPGETQSFHIYVQAWSPEKGEQELHSEDFANEEFLNRIRLVQKVGEQLVLETPEANINQLFTFAKIRTSESIYRTSGGLMHGPGGESYYAAIWANDQAEYVGPFFPYLGYETGNEASLNAYLHFARFMNEEYRPIPSSIIAEGKDIWDGAGDRGDAAMIAYGAARYALVRGDRAEAEQLWPLIRWTLEYCRRNLNESGVVKSNCDELEFRFPAGEANLCTSTLYYDALMSAGYLGKDLGKDATTLQEYADQAATLRKNIEAYFGAEMGEFHTYRYYDGNDLLRSWICMPLVVGIDDRASGTIDALFSPRLWTKDGLLTQEGSKTFWDRSTLYALRGVYAAGATEPATEHLRYYSRTRLLGEHVPYPIEAWPEGSQRHLAAESGLYCRVITEGLFGIRPTGLKSFDLTPRLPSQWPEMKLRGIRGFGENFDITVQSADDENLRILVTQGDTAVFDETVAKNTTVHVIF